MRVLISSMGLPPHAPVTPEDPASSHHHLGGRDAIHEFGGGGTDICFVAKSSHLFQTQPLIKCLCLQQLEEKLKGQADYEEVKKELR